LAVRKGSEHLSYEGDSGWNVPQQERKRGGERHDSPGLFIFLSPVDMYAI
jgi:hypothetical protein